MEKEEKEEKLRLPLLSYSKVTTFKRCPKCYKFNYIDKLPKEEKPYNILGSFCHDVLESFHNYFLNKEIKKEDFRKVMQISFKTQIKKFENKIQKEQIQEAYELIKNYLSLILKNEFPNVLAVEQKIWETVDNKFIFLGYIDRLQLDKDGFYHVIDYKTTTNKVFLKDDTQLKLYAYFVSQKNNLKDKDKVKVSYILLKHKSEVLTKLYTVKELKKTKEKFVEHWHVLEQEKLFRAIPRFDNCAICDFVSHCYEGLALQQRKKNFYGKENAW